MYCVAFFLNLKLFHFLQAQHLNTLSFHIYSHFYLLYSISLQTLCFKKKSVNWRKSISDLLVNSLELSFPKIHMASSLENTSSRYVTAHLCLSRNMRGKIVNRPKSGTIATVMKTKENYSQWLEGRVDENPSLLCHSLFWELWKTTIKK